MVHVACGSVVHVAVSTHEKAIHRVWVDDMILVARPRAVPASWQVFAVHLRQRVRHGSGELAPYRETPDAHLNVLLLSHQAPAGLPLPVHHRPDQQ